MNDNWAGATAREVYTMALIDRIAKPKPEPKKPVWLQRLQPKDFTGKVVL